MSPAPAVPPTTPKGGLSKWLTGHKWEAGLGAGGIAVTVYLAYRSRKNAASSSGTTSSTGANAALPTSYYPGGGGGSGGPGDITGLTSVLQQLTSELQGAGSSWAAPAGPSYAPLASGGRMGGPAKQCQRRRPGRLLARGARGLRAGHRRQPRRTALGCAALCAIAGGGAPRDDDTRLRPDVLERAAPHRREPRGARQARRAHRLQHRRRHLALAARRGAVEQLVRPRQPAQRVARHRARATARPRTPTFRRGPNTPRP